MPLIRKNSPTAPPKPQGSSSALRDGTTDERWSTARSLAAPEDVAALGAALAAEQDAHVREAILTSLARIGSQESVKVIVPYIRSDDAALRTAALDSLRMMPDVLSESLAELLSDPDADVRLLACELVRALPDGDAPRLLCDLIERDPEANVCAAAIDVLAEVGGPEALQPLENCAGRFAGEPFLAFAIKVAAKRIEAQPVNGLG